MPAHCAPPRENTFICQSASAEPSSQRSGANRFACGNRRARWWATTGMRTLAPTGRRLAVPLGLGRRDSHEHRCRGPQPNAVEQAGAHEGKLGESGDRLGPWAVSAARTSARARSCAAGSIVSSASALKTAVRTASSAISQNGTWPFGRVSASLGADAKRLTSVPGSAAATYRWIRSSMDARSRAFLRRFQTLSPSQSASARNRLCSSLNSVSSAAASPRRSAARSFESCERPLVVEDPGVRQHRRDLLVDDPRRNRSARRWGSCP